MLKKPRKPAPPAVPKEPAPPEPFVQDLRTVNIHFQVLFEDADFTISDLGLCQCVCDKLRQEHPNSQLHLSTRAYVGQRGWQDFRWELPPDGRLDSIPDLLEKLLLPPQGHFLVIHVSTPLPGTVLPWQEVEHSRLLSAYHRHLETYLARQASYELRLTKYFHELNEWRLAQLQLKQKALQKLQQEIELSS